MEAQRCIEDPRPRPLADVTMDPLCVDARLTLVNDRGSEVVVAADGGTITIAAPSLWIMAPYRGWLVGGRLDAALGLAERWLTRADLMIEFRVAGRLVALMGAEARPGYLSRVAGLAPLELRIGALLLSLFKFRGENT